MCRVQIQNSNLNRTRWRLGLRVAAGFAGVLVVVLLITEVSRAACSSPTANAGAIDWQSPVFKYCDGTNWLNFGGSSAGRTSCPAGFSLIGTSGSAEAFCISTNEEPTATWLDAATACYNKTPAARLCSASEWMMACSSGSPTGMESGGSEWVADTSIANAILLGNTCATGNYVAPTFTSVYRCCFR